MVIQNSMLLELFKPALNLLILALTLCLLCLGMWGRLADQCPNIKKRCSERRTRSEIQTKERKKVTPGYNIYHIKKERERNIQRESHQLTVTCSYQNPQFYFLHGLSKTEWSGQTVTLRSQRNYVKAKPGKQKDILFLNIWCFFDQCNNLFKRNFKMFSYLCQQ